MVLDNFDYLPNQALSSLFTILKLVCGQITHEYIELFSPGENVIILVIINKIYVSYSCSLFQALQLFLKSFFGFSRACLTCAPRFDICLFFLPDGDLPSHACNGGFCYLGCRVSHVTVATVPGARLCPEPRWPCQGHCRPTSLKPCWCLLFLLVPIFAVEPGKLGTSGASTVWRAPLPRHS